MVSCSIFDTKWINQRFIARDQNFVTQALNHREELLLHANAANSSSANSCHRKKDYNGTLSSRRIQNQFVFSIKLALIALTLLLIALVFSNSRYPISKII